MDIRPNMHLCTPARYTVKPLPPPYIEKVYNSSSIHSLIGYLQLEYTLQHHLTRSALAPVRLVGGRNSEGPGAIRGLLFLACFLRGEVNRVRRDWALELRDRPNRHASGRLSSQRENFRR